jgi:hypothetical protein
MGSLLYALGVLLPDRWIALAMLLLGAGKWDGAATIPFSSISKPPTTKGRNFFRALKKWCAQYSD